MTQEPSVRLRGLTKAFGGRVVLGPVDLDMFPGEFVALLGHNGAGKSTLIKILDGVYVADGGTVTTTSADDRAAVGVVHQDLGLIEAMSVVDNLRLGREPLRSRLGWLDRRTERVVARQALDRFGLEFDLDMLVRDLAPSERALLAVARVAISEPRLIVLDETTSVLSAADAAGLIATLRERSPEGVSFIMVTHKLDEALALANRVVILRDGRLVCDQSVPLPGLQEVTDLLAPGGHSQRLAAPEQAVGFMPETVLEFRDVVLGGLGPISLSVARGEAVAITGRMGADLPNIGYLAAGAVRPDSGEVWRPARVRSALVPPNREREGNLPELTVRENLTIGSLRQWRTRTRTLRIGSERRAAEEYVGSLKVLPASLQASQRTLSGGNQQKVIFGRALMTASDVYVLCEPTRGVDIATRRQIYDLMASLKAQGCGLLVVAADPQDVLAVSDRIVVIDDGRVSSEFDAVGLTSDALARLV